jgi:L-asparaginase
VLLITTGGTIAGNVATAEHVGEDDVTDDMKQEAEDFQRMIAPTRLMLEAQSPVGRKIEIDTHVLCDVDSSDIEPELWSNLSQLIYDKFDAYDSFIITHGTNTLGYSCAALSFAIVNSGKPIVLTGSQVPAGLPGTDALTNLENALRVATWDRSGRRGHDQPIQGVMAVFGSFIITGTRVKKDTEFDYDAFKSFLSGSIGRIGRVIDINEANLAKHRSYLSSGRFPTAIRQRELKIEPEFEMNIASVTEFPGMNPELFRSLVEQNDVKGFVLRAFGAGDPAQTLRPAFEYLKRKEIPIVVTTQAPNGNSNFQVNEPGKWLRDNKMAIPAFDMGIEAQTTKLGWLLAKKAAREITYVTLCERMVDDLRGEINVIWEIGA